MKALIWISTTTIYLLVLTACQDSVPVAVQPSPASPVMPTVLPAATAITRVVTPSPTAIAVQADATTAEVPVATGIPIPTTTAMPAPKPAHTPTRTAAPATAFEGPTLDIGGVRFPAEIANTPALRIQGLSDRPSLTEQTGMLFIFEGGVASNFWMKNMHFSLDFIWIGADCKVVSLTENVPYPESASSALPLYASSQPAAFNFEINGGEGQAQGLAIGDDVRFNGINVPGAHC